MNKNYRKLYEMAKRTSPEDFVRMVKDAEPNKKDFSLPDLMKIADDNDVQIPGDIRYNKEYKSGPHLWNFGNPDQFQNDKTELSSSLGDEVAGDTHAAGEVYNTAIGLSKAKTKEFTNLVNKGKVYVMGRKPNGAFFRVPGMDQIAAQIDRMIQHQAELGAGEATMEEQYDDLKEKVELVASGRSNFIRALLITGAPSAGKTYNVMKTIINAGLQEGKDYTKKTGKISVVALYRTLLQKKDALLVFDDCDSVVGDQDGVNILKGALDTGDYREISMDNRNLIDVDSFEPDKRKEYTDRVSRLLNDGEYTKEDFDFFLPICIRNGMKVKGAKKKKRDMSDDMDDLDDDSYDDDTGDLADEVLSYVTKRLPNKFIFSGRVIFISNLDEDDWDSAILSRAFRVQMNFKSIEMLDFIDKIKDNIKSPISADEKQEVVDYIRELWTLGKLKSPVNFRLIQQAFDLKTLSSWKRMVANL